MKINIPEHCHIRWQAALAVLEDLQEDEDAPFDMRVFAAYDTLWERNHGCGSPACFAGYISVAPYCRALGYPRGDNGPLAKSWLINGFNYYDAYEEKMYLYENLFDGHIDKGSRAETLAYLEKTLKRLFKESTGKDLKAPLTFYV